MLRGDTIAGINSHFTILC